MQTQRNINKYINKSIVTTHKPISMAIYGHDQTGTTGLCNPQIVMNCNVAKLATVWVPYNPYIYSVWCTALKARSSYF